MSELPGTRVLVVGQTPPPVHGQAVCIAQLVRGPLPGVTVKHLRMNYSSSTEQIGRFAWDKVGHLLWLTARAAWDLSRRPHTILYYPPGARLTPLLRDVVFLSLTRPLARATVLHFHAGGASEYLRSRPWLAPLVRLALGRAAAAIQLLPSASADGVYFAAARSVVVPNGAEIVRLPRRRAADDPTVRLLFVGLHGRDKGLDLAIRAVHALSKDGLPVELHTAGTWQNNEQKQDITQLVTELSAEGLVHFGGVLSGEEKWRAFADADLFVFPTSYEHEVMPVAVLEAMACGLPVVATRWRCMPDLVADGQTGVLVPPRRLGPLVDALAELVRSAGRRRLLGQAGRRRFERRFSLERHLEAMAALFREVDADAQR